MPKKPIDYTKSCVYRLIYNDVTHYVGSTTNMRQRKRKHKNNTNSKKSDKYDMELYKFIRENGGWDKWKMIQIEAYPNCKTSEELRKWERFHYEIYKPSLNSIRPYITEEERQKTQQSCCKKWSDANTEQISGKKAEYYQLNKESILEKERNRYAENSGVVCLRVKAYREENAEKIKERDRKKGLCECGCEINIRGKSAHIKTKKHINLMLEKEQQIVT